VCSPPTVLVALGPVRGKPNTTTGMLCVLLKSRRQRCWPKLLAALLVDTLCHVQELSEGHYANVLVCTHPYRNALGLSLFVADNKLIRDLPELGIAHLGVHPLRAPIYLDTQSGHAQRLCHLVSVLNVAVCDGNHLRLHRRKPDRKAACVVLD